MNKKILITATVLGALAVALGAFGAHGLKKIADADTLTIFETAVRYQFYHVFALALTGGLQQLLNNRFISNAGYFFLAGILLFSGSLYLLTFTHLQNLNWSWIGPVTPLGGACLIAGWISLTFGIYKGNKR